MQYAEAHIKVAMADAKPALKAAYDEVIAKIASDGKTIDDLVSFVSSGIIDPADSTNSTFWTFQVHAVKPDQAYPKGSVRGVLSIHYPPTQSRFNLNYVGSNDTFFLDGTGSTWPTWMWSQALVTIGVFSQLSASTVIGLGTIAYK